MKVDIMTEGCDTSIDEEQLLSLNDDDVEWSKKELGLSHEDLFRILVGAKKIVRELKPNDELLDLTYDTNGAWYISFARNDPDGRGRWKINVWREDQTVKEAAE
jgi:hypothetical protein